MIDRIYRIPYRYTHEGVVKSSLFHVPENMKFFMNASPPLWQYVAIQVLPVCVSSKRYFMETQNSFVAWTALVLAIIAIILAWVAFNRSGADLEEVIQREVEEATAEIRVNYEELEDEVRSSTANQLDEAATEVRTDEDEATTTP